MKLPDRWLNYSKISRINGTRFVAFKVPLRGGFSNKLPPELSFTPQNLLDEYSNIKLIIDLTYSMKYYNGTQEFLKKGVQYIKLRCKGRAIPNDNIFKRFVEIVDEFINKSPNDVLLGVHCTHGVNRTGYLIVRYMIERLGYSSEDALREFCRSRGHAIERTNYIEDLHAKASQIRRGLKRNFSDCLKNS